MNRYDVLIAGLGPTGITLAALLTQRGLKVAAFDKLPDLYPLPRAIGLDHEAMRILQQLGLAESLAPFIAPYRPSEYRGADGQPIRRLDAAPAPHPLGWFPNYVFNQPELERALRAHVASNMNMLVQLNTEVVDFGQDESAAWVDVRRLRADGLTDGENRRGTDAPVRFEGAYLIACDGGSSSLRKRLGMKLEDLGFDETWLVIDSIVSPDKAAKLPQTQVQYCNPARPATFVVGPGLHRRWEIMLHPDDSPVRPFPEEDIWRLLEPWARPDEITLWRSAAYRFHGLVAERWRERRIFLAGDAAHMTPPFMAQGMMQGLRDALNLSWKLTHVIRNGSHDSLLDSYEQERRPHVLATTQAAIELGRIICEQDPLKATERDTALRAKYKGETTTRQNLIPDLMGGLIHAESPGAGRIFPQPRLKAPRVNVLLDDLTGPVIRLVALQTPPPAAQARLLAGLNPLGGVLVCLDADQTAQNGSVLSDDRLLIIDEADAVIEPWMRSLGANYALVRPDHYVYGTADTMDGLWLLLRQLHERLMHFDPQVLA